MALETCIQGDQWVPIFNDTSALPPIITKKGQQHMKNTQRLPYWSKASFRLPLSSESLSFISRGRASGVLHITTSPDQEVDFATVNIWIIYEDAVLRNLTKACLVSRQAGDHGVGLFVRDEISSGHFPNFLSRRRQHKDVVKTNPPSAIK